MSERYLWPDGTLCFGEDLEEYLTHKSDDYEVIPEGALTNDERIAFVAGGGTVCPFCQAVEEISRAISQAGSHGTGRAHIHTEACCDACGNVWYETYFLALIETGKEVEDE